MSTTSSITQDTSAYIPPNQYQYAQISSGQPADSNSAPSKRSSPKFMKIVYIWAIFNLCLFLNWTQQLCLSLRISKPLGNLMILFASHVIGGFLGLLSFYMIFSQITSNRYSQKKLQKGLALALLSLPLIFLGFIAYIVIFQDIRLNIDIIPDVGSLIFGILSWKAVSKCMDKLKDKYTGQYAYSNL